MVKLRGIVRTVATIAAFENVFAVKPESVHDEYKFWEI